jgi:hypothetical protein
MVMHYVQLNIRTRFGPTDKVAAIFARIAPRLASLGWRMLGAWRPVMGDVSHLLLLFELDDLAHVANVREAVRQDPEINGAFRELVELVEGEDLHLLERLASEFRGT